MVVYDRVVPNEAIESLIALTVGVLIALGFEFILKTLRANFIDRAGKRADARMSRLVFDRLLSMPLDKRRNSSGAMASVVREFDTLREFFTSATLVRSSICRSSSSSSGSSRSSPGRSISCRSSACRP